MGHMNVAAAAKALNQKAAQQKWHHFCDPTLSFSMPRYNQLLSIWHSKAGSRKMVPRRRSDRGPRGTVGTRFPSCSTDLQ